MWINNSFLQKSMNNLKDKFAITQPIEICYYIERAANNFAIIWKKYCEKLTKSINSVNLKLLMQYL